MIANHLHKKDSHIKHQLNKSPSKTAFKFDRSSRFSPLKTYSPNKYYDLPSTFNRAGFSQGKSQRTQFQKLDSIEPTKYKITSEFDCKNHIRSVSSTFGINRDEYYQNKSNKLLIGPGSYNISRDLGKNNIYIGQKLGNAKHYFKPQYQNRQEAFTKLSTYKNEKRAYRMQTQYFPKNSLYLNDNKVPGPGKYQYRDTIGRHTRNGASTSFGASDRFKDKKGNLIGPGKYYIFSEFGQSEY